jgi:hypothetical protein
MKKAVVKYKVLNHTEAVKGIVETLRKRNVKCDISDGIAIVRYVETNFDILIK